MFQFQKKLFFCLCFLLSGFISTLHAQELVLSIQDKKVSRYLGDAVGLKMTNSGKILVTSSDEGVLLMQQGEHFSVIKLKPSIFKDNDLAGIDQMQDGRLVIVNEGSHKIAIVDEQPAEAVRKFSKSGGGAGELNDPRGLVVSINNKIYIADRDNNRISVFNDQGLFLQSFGNHGRDNSDLSKPTHIALDAEENIYVLEAGKSNRISIFSSTGKLIKQLDTKAIGKLLGSSIDFSAMTADMNGLLYLADDNSKQIFSYDWSSDNILNHFGVLGQSRGQYRNISFLSVNNKGQLAVLDKVNKKVEVYQLENTDYKQPVKTDVLKYAEKIDSSCRSVHAFINDQTLCIRKDKKGIAIMSAEGKVTGTFANEITKPTALHSGEQMVAILQKNYLHTYTHDGQKIFSIGRYGTSPGGFDGPTHVFSAHNRVYVADKGNNRIQIFSADGQFVDQVKGGSKKTFEAVGPVAVDSQQNIYVADQEGKHLIKVLNAQLELDSTIGYQQSSLHKAKKIHALDTDKQDRLYALITSGANDYSIRMYDQNQKIVEFGSGEENGSDIFFKTASSLSVSSTDKNSIYINDTKQKKLFRFDYLEYPDAAFGLCLNADKKQLKLEWDSTKSPLIASYEIQASSTLQGPFQKLFSTTGLTKTFSVEQAKNLSWFRIQTISSYGLRAKPSAARQNQFYKLALLFKEKHYSDVILLADKLLSLSPDNADALQLKADSQLLSGQHQAALASFRQLEQFSEYKKLAIRQQVTTYYELEKYLDAKSLVDQLLAQQPKEIYPYLVCTELSILLSDIIGAVTCAEDGLSFKPGHVRLRYLLGKAYILAGVDEQGMAEYQTVLDAHPDNHSIRLKIADDLMQIHKYEQALVHYSSVSTALPSSADALIGKAKTLLKLDRDDEAKAIAIKLSANKESKADGYYVLGKIAVKQKKYTEAVLRLTRSSKLNPLNIDSWISLAKAYIQLLQLPKAVKSLNQGIDANPDAFELYQLAGKLELEQENYPQANTYLDKAVNLNAQSLEANKAYARALFSTRNYRTAASYAERASKIAPKDIDVLTLQSSIASQQGKAGSAIEFLKTAISLQPASAELQYQLGQVYQQANLFDNSREHLDKAAGINPAWAEPHVALGQLFSKRRLFDQAIAAFEKAVSLNPSANNRAILNTAFADKKKSLEFKSNAPQLILSDLNLKHVFSAAYKQYANQSIGTVNLRNVGGTDYGNMQLSFQIKEYMDFPVTQEISQIKANESKKYDFKVTFNNKILEVDEDIGVQVEVKLSFNRDGQKDSIRITQPMTIYGKNAIIWADASMLGSFVTPKDDTLRNYVRTVINEYQPPVGPLNDRLVTAMTFFTSLTAAGTKYIVDPNTPYTSLRDDQVDYVQFPRETLKLKSGDCDDLSVLLSAGLENLGIETVFVEIPGHLFMMFNTGLAVEQSGLISHDSSLLAIRNNQLWIPLEATMVNSSFNEAWAEGASKYHKAKADKTLSIIDLKKAWQKYRPVTLQKAGYSIDIPAKDQAIPLIKSAQNQLLTKSINRLILPYQSMITNNPKDIQARMQVAILYTRYGLYNDAQMTFDALHEIAPDNSGVLTNQGNLFLLNGEFDKAIVSYQHAAKLDEKDGGIWLNLSMAHYRKGDLKAAADGFQQAVRLTPALQKQYSAYSKLLNQ